MTICALDIFQVQNSGVLRIASATNLKDSKKHIS